MKRALMILLSLTFPWLVFLIKDNPGAALMALIMQASIIGWLPASLWALRVSREDDEKTKTQQKS